MASAAAEVLAAFQKVLDSAEEEHSELIALGAAGWVEECPEECGWVFTHPEYPGYTVYWRVTGQPWVSAPAAES